MGRSAYLGIFLTPQSRRKLLAEFPPAHPNVRADHVTILWEPEIADLAGVDLGSIVRFSVVGYVEDQKGQAVAVILPSEIPKSNRTPHVTVSVADGVPAVYSNDLLRKGVTRIAPRTYSGVLELSTERRQAPSAFFPLAARIATRWLHATLQRAATGS